MVLESITNQHVHREEAEPR